MKLVFTLEVDVPDLESAHITIAHLRKESMEVLDYLSKPIDVLHKFRKIKYVDDSYSLYNDNKK